MDTEDHHEPVRILTEKEIAALLDLTELLPVVADGLVNQGDGTVERPTRSRFPVGIGIDSEGSETPLGAGLTMPAYIHGSDSYVTKLVSVHDGNPKRGRPTVQAQIAITDAETGRPVAYMDGERITNARTGCIGGLAARELARTPITLGLIGAGTQARWQARAIAAACTVESIRIYSPSDSKHGCAADLNQLLEVPATAVETPTDAVSGVNTVVTATTSDRPVFPGEALSAGTLVIAVGAYTPELQEIDPATVERASRVFADVPEEVAEIGDIRLAEISTSDLIPLASAVDGNERRTSQDEILLIESVGSAVLDAAAGEYIVQRAEEKDVGTTVRF